MLNDIIKYQNTGSQLVIYQNKISSMVKYKQDSQPPVPDPIFGRFYWKLDKPLFLNFLSFSQFKAGNVDVNLNYIHGFSDIISLIRSQTIDNSYTHFYLSYYATLTRSTNLFYAGKSVQKSFSFSFSNQPIHIDFSLMSFSATAMQFNGYPKGTITSSTSVSSATGSNANIYEKGIWLNYNSVSGSYINLYAFTYNDEDGKKHIVVPHADGRHLIDLSSDTETQGTKIDTGLQFDVFSHNYSKYAGTSQNIPEYWSVF